VISRFTYLIPFLFASLPLTIKTMSDNMHTESSSNLQLFDEGLDRVKFNNVHMPINVAYDRAVAYVEAGKGNWRRTSMRIQDSATFAFQLSCATCEKKFSMTNPSGFWATHSKACKDNGARGQVLEAGEQAAVAPAEHNASSSRSLSTFMSSAQQQEAFNRHMSMACITSCVPFTFFENEHFKAAAGVFGVKLPSRKVLSTTILDSIFEEVQESSAQSLAHLTFIDASSDGWRKKHCESGAALMNFCALTPTGALMFDALNCSDMRKDGEGIAALLEAKAKEMTDGNPVRLAGWVLDNTKANWSAMQQLQGQYPEWVMRGCLAHGLSLAMKDFTGFTKGVYHVLQMTCNVAPHPQKYDLPCNPPSKHMLCLPELAIYQSQI
jgi:hypothetical protein